MNLIKNLGYDTNLENFKDNNFQNDIQKIQIDNFNYEVPKFLIEKKIPEKLSNILICFHFLHYELCEVYLIFVNNF